MSGSLRVTDLTLRAWLRAGAVDKGVGGGLTFQASVFGAEKGQASWILRYRFGGRNKELVLGRYPDVALKDARELARAARAKVQQGVDPAAEKRVERLDARERGNVSDLAALWFKRYIADNYKHPQPVWRVFERHIKPAIGRLPASEVRPVHIDRVLTRVVAAGAPTVANDVLRYMYRMFHYGLKLKWTEVNPVAGFEISDAGGTESSRTRWLSQEELIELARAMRETPNFGRENELSVWLLLALCVRKMELLSAKWSEFDLENGVWELQGNRTKTAAFITIPLAPQVLLWLREVKVFSGHSEYLFPARRRIRKKAGKRRENRFEHVSPDTLNVALMRLSLADFEHFTVHDMRRTARTHLAGLGVEPFVAERALNHKLPKREGTYDRFDYYGERKEALNLWAQVLTAVYEGRQLPSAFSARKPLRQLQRQEQGTPAQA